MTTIKWFEFTGDDHETFGIKGVEVEIEYEFFKGYPATRYDEGESDHVEILKLEIVTEIPESLAEQEKKLISRLRDYYSDPDNLIVDECDDFCDDDDSSLELR